MAKISTDKKKSLRGVVLIMVVTVMFVLIIMLLATLSVVSTAQNRYYTKYEENQAYYTARSALDVFTNNLVSDSNYISIDGSGNAREFKYTDDSGASKTVDMSQGLGLELEFYKIKSQSMYNGVDYSSKVWANIPHNGVFANTAEKDNFTLDATPVDSITYTVTFPYMSGTNQSNRSANYGRFVDEVSGTQVANIKVEVIKRIYNLGGAGAAYTEDDLLHMGEAGRPTQADVEAAIAAGSRNKDYMLLKVTSTVEFMGTTGTAVVYYQTTEPEVIISGNAMTSFGGIDLNNMTILGGASTDDDAEPKNMGKVYGGIFASGDMHMQGGGTAIPLTKKEVIFIGDEFSWQNSAAVCSYGVSASDLRSEYPLVYVNGTAGKTASSAITATPGGQSNGFTWGGGSSGAVTDAIDLVVHGFGDIINNVDINGNVYCIGDFDSRSSTGINFYNNGAAFINGNLYVENIKSGTYYVDGDVILPDSSADGAQGKWLDAYSLGTVKLPAGVSIKTSGKFLTIEGDDFVCDSVGGRVSINGGSYVGMTTQTGVWDAVDLDATELASEKDVEISLPKLDVSGNKLIKTTPETYEIPTYLSEYAAYLHRDAGGAFSVDASGKHYPMTAAEYAGTNESDRLIGSYTAQDFDYLTAAPSAIVISRKGNGVTDIGGVSSNNPEISCASTADYYLETSSWGYDISQGYKNFKISGGGKVNIYLKPGYYKGEIVIDDDTTVNFYAPKGGDYHWEMKVYNNSLKTKQTSGTTVMFGNSATAEPAPKINYYIDGDASTTDTFFTNQYTQIIGYVYAPYTKIKVDTAPNDSLNWDYKDGAATGSEKFLVIGSLVAGEIDMGSNNIGVAYIDPNTNSYTPGKPMFKWQAKYYDRM